LLASAALLLLALALEDVVVAILERVPLDEAVQALVAAVVLA
jgi:hypothetical protein